LYENFATNEKLVQKNFFKYKETFSPTEYLKIMINTKWFNEHKEIKSMFDRHVLVSSGPLLTSEQWEVCGVACYRACSNSLQELHQLTMAFSPRSESFYGDVAQVKVAARRDATPEETERLRQLAAQVSNPRFIFEKCHTLGRMLMREPPLFLIVVVTINVLY